MPCILRAVLMLLAPRTAAMGDRRGRRPGGDRLAVGTGRATVSVTRAESTMGRALQIPRAPDEVGLDWVNGALSHGGGPGQPSVAALSVEVSKVSGMAMLSQLARLPSPRRTEHVFKVR